LRPRKTPHLDSLTTVISALIFLRRFLRAVFKGGALFLRSVLFLCTFGTSFPPQSLSLHDVLFLLLVSFPFLGSDRICPLFCTFCTSCGQFFFANARARVVLPAGVRRGSARHKRTGGKKRNEKERRREERNPEEKRRTDTRKKNPVDLPRCAHVGAAAGCFCCAFCCFWTEFRPSTAFGTLRAPAGPILAPRRPFRGSPTLTLRRTIRASGDSSSTPSSHTADSAALSLTRGNAASATFRKNWFSRVLSLDGWFPETPQSRCGRTTSTTRTTGVETPFGCAATQLCRGYTSCSWTAARISRGVTSLLIWAKC
jgi:hypothetical protein